MNPGEKIKEWADRTKQFYLDVRSEMQDASAPFIPAQPARRSGGRRILLLLVLAALCAAAWFGRDWLP